MLEGIVYKSTGSWYLVKSENKFFECRIKGKIRLKDISTTNPIAVGDQVKFELESDGKGIISDILPRENYIIRKSVNLSKQYHIIASNIDISVLVVTLNNPVTSTNFIDRFLVSCQAYDIPVIIAFQRSSRRQHTPPDQKEEQLSPGDHQHVHQVRGATPCPHQKEHSHYMTRPTLTP